MRKSLLLTDLDVLALDIQATAPNPSTAFIVEIGWVKTRARDIGETVKNPVQSHLVALPEGESIPRAVSRVTGLKTTDLENGTQPETMWDQLTSTAQEISEQTNVSPCPTVIHFARYEEPFLHHLHQTYSAETPFAFDIICTFQLARRLLFGLPSKGLRAVAGYLGFSLPEHRRAGDHATATAFTWAKLVALLADQGIRTLADLNAWLKSPPARTPVGQTVVEFPMPPALRRQLPDQPGVYRMRRSNGDILYIGKATSLKKRVNSYFHRKKRSGRSRLTLEMLSQAGDLDVTVTGSALEAAMLETDEIKHHSPPYNIALRTKERKIGFLVRSPGSIPTVELEPEVPGGSSPVMGPLPLNPSTRAFASIHNLLLGASFQVSEVSDERVPEILDIPIEYAPDAQNFVQGLELFQQRHGEQLESYPGHRLLRGLLVLGKEFRRQKMLEDAAAEADSADSTDSGDSDEDETETMEAEERTWTPELVADMVGGIIRRGATLVRRSRWYCLLSESVICWNTGETAGGRKRLLVIEKGQITHREEPAVPGAIPVPPGHGRDFCVRRQGFDLAVHDRMRVLTTELRRLSLEGKDRELVVCTAPGVTLDGVRLRALFQWI